ncbi:MAG: hypothetical protein PHF31_14915 [Methylobacter sp.]|nr:hypothetical protein [Methylobacter sp.]
MPLTTCRICKKAVEKNTKTCPHCGASRPEMSNAISIFALVIIALSVAFVIFSGSNESAQTKDFAFTVDGIKSLSIDITSVYLTPQFNKPDTFLVEIELNKNPFTGGAQDWNSISAEVFSLSKSLLAKQNTDKIHFVFRSPDNNNLDWARIFVDRKELPKDWENLTYLQFFGISRPLPGTLETGRWLCDFYKKYESSRPNGLTPDFCKE